MDGVKQGFETWRKSIASNNLACQNKEKNIKNLLFNDCCLPNKNREGGGYNEVDQAIAAINILASCKATNPDMPNQESAFLRSQRMICKEAFEKLLEQYPPLKKLFEEYKKNVDELKYPILELAKSNMFVDLLTKLLKEKKEVYTKIKQFNQPQKLSANGLDERIITKLEHIFEKIEKSNTSLF